MNIDKVFKAIGSGLSCVCATCDWYWESESRGVVGCRHTDCCGPLGGKTFPRYKGQMTDFSRFCFVCSASSAYGVAVGDSQRILGVCQEHVSVLKGLGNVSLKNGGLRTGVESQIVRPKISRLSQLLAEGF